MYPLFTPHTHNFGSVVKISPPLLLLKKQAASSQYRAWYTKYATIYNVATEHSSKKNYR